MGGLSQSCCLYSNCYLILLRPVHCPRPLVHTSRNHRLESCPRWGPRAGFLWILDPTVRHEMYQVGQHIENGDISTNIPSICQSVDELLLLKLCMLSGVACVCAIACGIFMPFRQ